MFSSLNSFLRNSCGDRQEFASAFRPATITFLAAAPALWHPLECSVVKKTVVSVGAGQSGRAELWLESEEVLRCQNVTFESLEGAVGCIQRHLLCVGVTVT